MTKDYMDIWEEEAVKPKNSNVKTLLSETGKTFIRGWKRITSKNEKASGAWKRYKELSDRFGMDIGMDKIMNPKPVKQGPGMFDDDLILGRKER